MKQVVAITDKEMTSSVDEIEVPSDASRSPPYSPPSSLPSLSESSEENQVVLLKYGSAVASLRVKLEFASLITAFWKDFKRSLVSISPEIGDSITTTELLARLLAYNVSCLEDDAQSYGRRELTHVLNVLLDAFEAQCVDNDVHATVLGIPSMSEESKFATISACFRARQLLGRSFCAGESAIHRSVKDGTHCAYAIFGGQGLSSTLEELRQLNALYEPILGHFIRKSSKYLESLIADSSSTAMMYPKGLNIAAWIDQPESQPDLEYIVSAPVSFPLIGVLQLANYKVLVHLLGCLPKDMATFFSGIGGHSQGVVTAVVASLANEWISFETLSLTALKVLFSIGCRGQEAFDAAPVGLAALRDSEDHGEGVPSCMLSIKGLPLGAVEKVMGELNTYLPRNEKVELALVNGPQHFVLGGPPSSLYCFNKYLRLTKATPNISQARLPFSQRKPDVNTSYLPITAPFHTSYLSAASEIVLEDLRDFEFSSADLKIPVYNTKSGQNLQDSRDKNLIPDLVQMIMRERLDWTATTSFLGATLLIDLGPGRKNDGMGPLTDKNKRGTGVRTINFSTLQATSPEVGCRTELSKCSGPINSGSDWKKDFSPRLAVSASGQKLLDTKLSRLLGLPPVMVAGMTPTTCSWEFVSATMNAGYHVELAAGGFYDAKSMEEAIRRLIESMPAGRGVTCNVIYADPRALKWQIALIKRLRAQNQPIEGLTVGAGIPSPDVANFYIRDLGLKHISFKPGSVQAVRQVIDIARSNPDFPIILQWTGGRAGGHHSFEDFHDPILKTYHDLRSCPNVILVAGSGMGNVQDSYPYLSGEWSTRLGYAHMPFDGILLGSRVMVATETRTCQEVKQLICQLPGVPNEQWEGTYERETGGILTVTSEMGEPIHKVATRAVKLWSELDKTIFSIKDKSERLKMLRKKQDHIISRLNADFTKVWFGRTSADWVSTLDEMTYGEVMRRLIDLTYLRKSQTWMHISYRDLSHEFFTQVESRFVSSCQQPRTVKSINDLRDPDSILKLMETQYPQLSAQLISHQDQELFTSMCRRRGRKPVPFITALDEEFEYWFKKDSLWQSENLETVPDQDVGRVCILHSPVSARYSSRTDETIKDILDGLHEGYLDKLQDSGYSSPSNFCLASQKGDETMILNGSGSIEAADKAEKIMVEVNDCLVNRTQDANLSKEKLMAEKKSRRHIAFTTKTILRGRQVFDNPILDVFKIGSDMWIETQGSLTSSEVISLYEFDKSTDQTKKVAELCIAIDGAIDLKIITYDSLDSTSVALVLQLKLESSLYPLREVTIGRNERVKDFYHRVWFGKKPRLPASTGMHDLFQGGEVEVTPQSLRQFTMVVSGSNNSEGSKSGRLAPLDYAVVVAWEALVKPLFLVDGNLLNLVHLKNEFKLRPGASPIMENDKLSSTSRVTALLVQEAGTMIEVAAQISRSDSVVMEVTSQFLFRGTFADHEETFKQARDPEMLVDLDSPKAVAVLRSKRWLELDDPSTDLLGKKLLFKTYSRCRYGPTGDKTKTEVNGDVRAEIDRHGTTAPIGRISWTSTVSNKLVSEYLDRHGRLAKSRVMFDDPLTLDVSPATFFSPTSNTAYARASGDLNPIHLSRVTAAYAQLPGTITHGMCTSARVRDIFGRQVCGGDSSLFRTFSASFTSMVLPNDQLQLTVQHVGMDDGRKIFQFHAYSPRTGLTVIEGEAEVESSRIAFIFTGQGSQQKGMGMNLRQSSPVARRLWDRADAYFLHTYGFRISDIVINDPKDLTVHFGGVHGRKIRQNYMDLTYQRPGAPEATQIFEDIDNATSSHTFRSELGLLSATQFTQPALTLMEVAIWEDLESRGVLSKTTTFAGHSLGEYTAILALGKLVPLETLMSIVFYRGLSMQVAVERDEANRSPFAMFAINPQKLSVALKQHELELVVRIVAEETGFLLEIVNYNVEGSQYVCAGDVRAALCLCKFLDHFHSNNPESTTATNFADYVTVSVRNILPDISETPLSAENLSRAVATTPLTGIDIPFHSSFMKGGIPAFRRFLYSHIQTNDVDPAKLINRYVPNLTAKLFNLERCYFERTNEISNSPVLGRILERWDDFTLPGFSVDDAVDLLRSFRAAGI